MELLIGIREEWDNSIFPFSVILGCKIKFLRKIIFNKHHHYKTVYIPKKRGSHRIIDMPSVKLKEIQRRILNSYLLESTNSSNCHGFVRERSIVTNASKHIKKKVVLKMDLKDFFHSITKERIYGLLLAKGLTPQVARYVAELCTFNDRLPQGAPTSPALSNLACINLDKRLTYLAKKSNLDYSRYTDDLTFSGEEITRPFCKLVQSIIESERFNVNLNKICLVKSHKPQIVTGIVVNDKISFGRKKYKALLGMLRACQKGNIEDQRIKSISYKYKINNMKLFLEGIISHIYAIDPIKADKLKHEFKAISVEKWREYERDSSISSRSELLVLIIRTIKRINGRFNDDLFERNTSMIIPSSDFFPTLESVSTYCIEISDYLKRMNLVQIGAVVINNQTLNGFQNWIISKGYTESDAKNVLETFRDITTLADNISRHGDKSKVEKILLKYNLKLYSKSFDKLIDLILKRCWISLIRIEHILQEQIY